MHGGIGAGFVSKQGYALRFILTHVFYYRQQLRDRGSYASVAGLTHLFWEVSPLANNCERSEHDIRGVVENSVSVHQHWTTRTPAFLGSKKWVKPRLG
jgi:hypothetical protein